MPVKPLTMREWLEQERLSGLPHADFAADALLAIDERDTLADESDDLLDRINAATGDMVEDNRQIVEAFVFRGHVLRMLNEAGVADGDVTGEQAAGLLGMFLPV